ncbi:tyrosine-type recombinase/integrase [Humisphaera borealis]|uniref:Site-specific integrase n=1 Tax=Humisphaera borealis TaxID=2807512 RepID=A0A7M2WWJ6_9BACT|nr:tyrosine-type recombinase/integrase [Humisphaera borealis]QOV89572.1 site-specific integrase [Humisphaera borealis]
MPRPKATHPAYCLHRRSGRAYATIAGKQHTFPGPHGSDESRSAYDLLIAQWLKGGRVLPAVKGGTGPTVSMIACDFWRYAEKRYVAADGTPTGEAENYRYALRILRRLYANVPAVEFGPKKLKALREYALMDRTEQDDEGREVVVAGWSRTYCNRQVDRIQNIFRWAASEELIPVAVSQALDTVESLRYGTSGARETEAVVGVPDALVDATLPFLPPSIAAVVKLQRLTGARGGELLKLRTCDIDMTGDVWKFKPADHKTKHKGKVRVIRFGPQAKDILTEFLRPDVQTYLFRPVDANAWMIEQAKKRAADRKAPPPTPSRLARLADRNAVEFRPKYDKNAYALAVARACVVAFPLPGDLARVKVPCLKSNGRRHLRWETPEEWKARLGNCWLEVMRWRDDHHWHPHMLRHASASKIRRESDLDASRIILGHSEQAMTEHYAEVDDRRADEVIAKLG